METDLHPQITPIHTDKKSVKPATICGQIRKPVKICVPLADGLRWRGGGGKFIYQEKMDGCFAAQATDDGHLIAGEMMRDGTPFSGGHTARCFYAFDILEFKGENLRSWPLRERLRVLNSVLSSAPLRIGGQCFPVPTGSGGEFLEHVLARGGEGIVAKDLDAPWGAPMLAAKRIQDFYCIVTRFCGGKQSVEIGLLPPELQPQRHQDTKIEIPTSCLGALAVQSIPCGRVSLMGGKIERVRIGSIIKVCGMNLTADGKLREPRLDNDTPTSWLVRF